MPLLYAPARASVIRILPAAGVVLGVLGDVLLREPVPIGVNLPLWIAAVAATAWMLHRKAAIEGASERLLWLAVGVSIAGGLAWREAPPLQLMALASAIVAFALAAARLDAAWVRRSGVLRYGVTLALGALHAWTAAAAALVDFARHTQHVGAPDTTAWSRTAAVARGVAIAAPLVAVFGALLMSADAIFAHAVSTVIRFDIDRVMPHVVIFAVSGWLAVGYLRGFMTETDQRLVAWRDDEPGVTGLAPGANALGATEVVTALALLDLLFLTFVVVQFRYLFGGGAIVQVTPDLTYAEYARRGFFELVTAVALVIPVLLAADWLVDRRQHRDDVVFRAVAGVQIVLVLVMGASALERLRLYGTVYGLTSARFYAASLLVWLTGVLLWLAATVLRGRRERFAFGALASALAGVVLLFVMNPDATIARTNVARMASPDVAVRFDVAYASSLSADAVPVLVSALPALPADVQCHLARQVLRRWTRDRDRPLRRWNWSAMRANAAVAANEAGLRAMVPADSHCESDSR